jgi:hypothetical protein
MGRGESGKQGRHQNQAATTDDGIDKTGKQRGNRDDEQFHGHIVMDRNQRIKKCTGVAGAFFLFVFRPLRA